VEKGHKLSARSDRLDDEVWRLQEAIKKNSKRRPIPIASKPNTPWIKASTLLMESNDYQRYMYLHIIIVLNCYYFMYLEVLNK